MPRSPKEKTTDTKSVILTFEQIDTIEQLRRKRSTPYAEASFASVMREVVDAGLQAISCEPDSIFKTSPEAVAA